MKFRTKLFCILVAVAVLTNAVSMAVMYGIARRCLLESFTSKVLSIAATAASMLDGNLHSDVRTRADEGSAAYQALRDQLRRARDANRRPDTYVKYLTSIVAGSKDPTELKFGVDPEENSRDVSHVEDEYKSRHARRVRVDIPGVDSTASEDQWGSWIEANAPVRDKSGRVVAAVLADVSSAELDAKLQPLWISALVSTGIAMTLAFLAALFLSARFSSRLRTLVNAFERIGRGDLESTVELDGRDEFAGLGRAVNTMTVGLRERETVKAAFVRYVSRQVMDSVLASGEAPIISGDRRKVTVLFCDIRGFTRMSESMRPEDVVQILNEYFEKVVEIVFRNGGTLDKFIGDGVMVVFGAPKDDPYQEEHAVRAALEIRDEVRRLSGSFVERGLPPLAVGVGVNSGNAIVGNIGSSQRMEYTAIGDTVNLASRLESATRELNVDILVSEYTLNGVRGAFKMNPAGSLRVKGRNDTIAAYTLDEDQPAAGGSSQTICASPLYQ
jgi:adenylate cyclase